MYADNFLYDPPGLVCRSTKAINEKEGNSINAPGIGEVLIEKKHISGALKYLHNPEEYAGFYVLPEVISKGIIIEDRINHKNRNVNTKTIGGYVRINGIDSFVGVVVRIGGKNRYYVHRVILPDGAELIFDNKKTEPIGVGITANGDKRSTISSVNEIIPNNGNESNGKIKESRKENVNLLNNKDRQEIEDLGLTQTESGSVVLI